MQENRIPALNLVNPGTRNQQQRSQIPGNLQPHANLDQKRGWGTQHSPHPSPEPLGTREECTQAGGGHTAHPGPLTVTRRSPCPTQVLGIHSAHTHTHTGRPATRSARWSSVLGARLPHSTLRGTQVTSSHCDGEWQHPPCRAAPLSKDSRSAHHRNFQPHHVGASPVTSRGDKSHQRGTTR